MFRAVHAAATAGEVVGAPGALATIVGAAAGIVNVAANWRSVYAPASASANVGVGSVSHETWNESRG